MTNRTAFTRPITEFSKDWSHVEKIQITDVSKMSRPCVQVAPTLGRGFLQRKFGAYLPGKVRGSGSLVVWDSKSWTYRQGIGLGLDISRYGAKMRS